VFLNNLGTALENTGYPEEAAKTYEAALAVDSSYTKASVSLARVTQLRQQADSQSVDLGELSLRFQHDIEGWRQSTQPADSSQSPSATAVTDSGSAQITGLSDSSTASVAAVSDTLEECAADSE
jgi:Tfp pilus assembly protein PilF